MKNLLIIKNKTINPAATILPNVVLFLLFLFSLFFNELYISLLLLSILLLLDFKFLLYVLFKSNFIPSISNFTFLKSVSFLPV